MATREEINTEYQVQEPNIYTDYSKQSKQDIIREGIFKTLFPYSNTSHYTGDETVEKVYNISTLKV